MHGFLPGPILGEYIMHQHTTAIYLDTSKHVWKKCERQTVNGQMCSFILIKKTTTDALNLFLNYRIAVFSWIDAVFAKAQLSLSAKLMGQPSILMQMTGL